MPLPVDFILVRHGHSERNRMIHLLESQRTEDLMELAGDAFFYQHDAKARLTSRGVQQAKAAGEWLRDNDFHFNRFYVSPHTRALETAALLKLGGSWKIDDRFRERDWGLAGEVRKDYAPTISTSSLHLKELNFWYWKPDAGESLATGVRSRAQFILESLFRKHGDEQVIAVTHGEFIMCMQFLLESLTPEEFNKRWVNPTSRNKLQNTTIVHYSRRDPEDPTHLTETYSWRRGIVPWDLSLSWDNGKWVKLEEKQYSDSELLELAEKEPHLFSNENRNL